MKARLPLKSKMEATLIKQGGFNPIIPIGTKWEWEHLRKNAAGIYEKIDEWTVGNVCMTQGLNHMLDVTFHGSTAIATWYLTLFKDNYTPLIGDTYQVPGFTEIVAGDTTGGTRIEYIEAAASGKVTTNTASKASFTMDDTLTIYGAALVGGIAGGGAAATAHGDVHADGRMFCASKFSSAKSVVATDILQVSCSITLADV